MLILGDPLGLDLPHTLVMILLSLLIPPEPHDKEQFKNVDHEDRHILAKSAEVEQYPALQTQIQLSAGSL